MIHSRPGHDPDIGCVQVTAWPTYDSIQALDKPKPSHYDSNYASYAALYASL